MTFGDIKGNEDVKNALMRMVDSHRVPHAMIFSEDDGGGAFPMCLAFLQYLFYGNQESSKIARMMHPDIHFVFPIQAKKGVTSSSYASEFRTMATADPYFTERDLSNSMGVEGKQITITVDEAGYICDKLAFNSLEGGYKAVVIYLPEAMTIAASNKILKTLEEPSEKTVIVMISHDEGALLQTISSRCQHIRIRPDRTRAVAETDEMAECRALFTELMTALTERKLSAALDVADSLAALPSRERGAEFCRYAAGQLRKVFMVQQGMPQLSYVSPVDQSDVERWAKACKKTFPRLGMGMLDRAVMLIERNVNQKILFCDLVDRMFLSI